MLKSRTVASKEIYLGRLSRGDDLLEALTAFCRENDVRLGRVRALGAVQKASIACYDQERREYDYFSIDRPLEITNLTGNVSEKDGKPIVHAHLTLADETGAAFGGHLAKGTSVFACEFVIESFAGPPFRRTHDEVTGLPLWEMDG